MMVMIIIIIIIIIGVVVIIIISCGHVGASANLGGLALVLQDRQPNTALCMTTQNIVLTAREQHIRSFGNTCAHETNYCNM